MTRREMFRRLTGASVAVGAGASLPVSASPQQVRLVIDGVDMDYRPSVGHEIIIEMGGRVLAEAMMPHLPAAASRYGLT